MCAVLNFCQTPIKVGLPMHGQFYPHFGFGLHIHMRPTVTLGLNLTLTCVCSCHWSWRLLVQTPYLQSQTPGSIHDWWKLSVTETAINLKLFLPIAVSVQACNWFPLIAGAATSELCWKLALHTHCPHQEMYLCMIDSECGIRILRRWSAQCKTH